MKKVVLLVALVAPAIGAYAEAPRAGDNLQLASYHRHYHSHGYGRMDDQSAEGRTSG